jgi:hypothetical protein
MFKYGDLRGDGYFFMGYVKSGPKKGTEKWISPKANATRLAKSKRDNQAREARRKADPSFRVKVQAAIKEWNRADYRRGMLHRARTAGKMGTPFDLESIDDIPHPTCCPVFGVELVMGAGRNHKWSPSIDKIIPEKGYVKGNVIVVSHFANSIKSNATPEQIMAVAKFYKKLSSKNLKRNF